jgi:hypothetical protein
MDAPDMPEPPANDRRGIERRMRIDPVGSAPHPHAAIMPEGRVMTDPVAAPRFALFRAKDATDFEESGLMATVPPTPIEMAGSIAAVEAGMLEGTRVKLLFSMPGLSLTHAWFRSGFPLPRHSHDVDCLYFILAGSLRIGTEELGAGDGFFVGANVPYTYVPGDQGVEVLEFRGSDSFDIRMLANNRAYWDRAVAQVAAQRTHWTGETPPSGLSFGPEAGGG